MEIKLIITIDEKVERLAEKIIAAVTSARQQIVAPEAPKAPVVEPKEEKPAETKKVVKKAAKVEEPVVAEPTATESKSPFDDAPSSVSLGDIIQEVAAPAEAATVKLTSADARVAVTKARDRKVNMDAVKSLITEKYGAANVSSIALEKIAEFISDVEKL